MKNYNPELAEYIKKRLAKADLMTYRAERWRVTDLRDGDDMLCEAEGRIDELERIWAKFCERGDK